METVIICVCIGLIFYHFSGNLRDIIRTLKAILIELQKLNK